MSFLRELRARAQTTYMKALPAYAEKLAANLDLASNALRSRFSSTSVFEAPPVSEVAANYVAHAVLSRLHELDMRHTCGVLQLVPVPADQPQRNKAQFLVAPDLPNQYLELP